MAISPPSDILLDVANAADPAQVRLATAKLAKLASGSGASDADFSKILTEAGRARKTVAAAAPLRPTIGAPPGTREASAKGAAGAYQKFEALLLQNFVESMLPKDDDLYGDKMSAGVYRSMMAEQFAAQLSKVGGIGIAKSMAAKHPAVAQTAALPETKPADG